MSVTDLQLMEADQTPLHLCTHSQSPTPHFTNAVAPVFEHSQEQVDLQGGEGRAGGQGRSEGAEQAELPSATCQPLAK